jgi:hypothetical protein
MELPNVCIAGDPPSKMLSKINYNVQSSIEQYLLILQLCYMWLVCALFGKPVYKYQFHTS